MNDGGAKGGVAVPHDLGSRRVSPDALPWERQVDVIVVGSGAAGFSAALTASACGASVLVLEKAITIGGTTKKAGGGVTNKATVWIWAPNNSLMREEGMEDPKEDAMRYMARLARPHLYDPNDPHLGLPEEEYGLIETFYERAAEAFDFLAEIGAVELGLRAHSPDYHASLPENRAPFGRAMSVKDGAGADGTGENLILRMEAAADERGVTVLTGRRVRKALVDGSGRVVGVEVGEEDGRVTRYRALKGVVFATGGFTHSRMVLDYLGGPVLGGLAAGTNEGDFLRIAATLGARLGNMNNAWLTPMILDHGPNPRSGAFVLPGDSMAVVNKYGERVVNEKATYNEVTRAFFGWDPSRVEYPNLLLFMVYDQRTAELFASSGGSNTLFGEDAENAHVSEGGANPIPGRDSDGDHVVSGETLEELARNLEKRLEFSAGMTGGLRLAPDFSERLIGTVERFNRFAREGRDPDFRRGEDPTELRRTGPARPGNDKNPTMYPFESKGPYHAIILAPGTLDTKGGPMIDVEGRVLDAGGGPIPGLYGAGNCVASPSGQAYWGGGATIGLAMVFGYVAGAAAARAEG